MGSVQQHSQQLHNCGRRILMQELAALIRSKGLGLWVELVRGLDLTKQTQQARPEILQSQLGYRRILTQLPAALVGSRGWGCEVD